MRRQLLIALHLHTAVSLCAASFASAGQPQATTRQTPSGSSQKPATRPPAIPAGMRLLGVNEGRAIVERMAWADDEEGLRPDCSHLVHTLYEQAGYSYPYASSLDLYRGTGHFVRVSKPQPGDLIVWRGHVGIVVNPKEHTFFSTTSAGAQTQDYRSAYWRSRGYSRFFRYLTSRPAPSGGKVEAANRTPEPQSKAQAANVSAENRPPSLQAVKTAPTAASKGRSEMVQASAVRPADKSVQLPLRIAGKQPQAADVANALAVANLDASEILRAGNLERLERPVVVYRDLQVSGVEVKGKRGAAQVQIETVAAVSAERMEAQLGWEDHSLELQRTKNGWVMAPANQNAYVPREAAMRILAARLASLTESAERGTGKDREQADIIRFLNLLIQ